MRDEVLLKQWKQLTYRQRQLLKLLYGEPCYTHEEVGHIFKLKTSTVRAYARRAARALFGSNA